MKFVKMHGIGNDYVYVDAFRLPALERRFTGPGGRTLIKRISDRHTGVGSDGVILLCRPTRRAPDAHVRMRMFNADGSEGEMCGNGIRCVAKFAHDRLGILHRPMRIETGRGTLSIDSTTRAGVLVSATVDMGPPELELARIPVKRSALVAAGRAAGGTRSAPPGVTAIRIDQETLHPRFVSMGNPHAVVYERGMSFKRLAEIGPVFERHPAFPKRINLHVAEWTSRREVTMKTWERGSGITQACGTGACAVVVAGAQFDGKARDALVHLPGGDLRVRWDAASGHVFMTGPAEDVFEGEWPDGE